MDYEKDIDQKTPETKITKRFYFRKMYLAAIACLFYPLSMGATGAFSAVATDDMKRLGSRIRPTQDEVTWIGSLLAVGALFGGAAAGYITERFGRKRALMLYSIPFVLGWLLIGYAPNMSSIYAGRFITGLCVGAVCAIAPPYLVEISTPEIRGVLGSSFQVCAILGSFIGSGFAYFMDWRWQALSCCVLPIIGLYLIAFMPESPRWLVAKGQHEPAMAALKFLQGPDFDAEAECLSIHEDISSQFKGSMTLSDFLTPGIYKPLLLSIGIIIFQQLCGVNAILFYSVQVFEETSSPISAYGSSLLLQAIMVIATIVSCFLLDRIGRKIMLIISGIGMAVSLFILSGFDYGKSLNPELIKEYSWVPLITITADVVSFSQGFGPIPWLMIAEMSPSRARGMISSTASVFCWGFVFVVTKSVDFLKANIGNSGTYCLYGVFCVISCAFTLFFLPETKGKTFEEIQLNFLKVDEHDNRKRSIRYLTYM